LSISLSLFIPPSHSPTPSPSLFRHKSLYLHTCTNKASSGKKSLIIPPGHLNSSDRRINPQPTPTPPHSIQIPVNGAVGGSRPPAVQHRHRLLKLKRTA